MTAENFVTAAVCQRILTLPRDQLSTISSVLSHISDHGADTIQLPTEAIRQDSPAVLQLRSLRDRLEALVRENGFSYIANTSSPKALLRRMAGVTVDDW